jgi:putative PIN family toxin of toxin-antitoxin system
MARVVLDTNVLVSAFLKGGVSRKLLLDLLQTQNVVLSAPMLAELADVLSREKFGVKAEAVNRYISILIRQTIVVPFVSNIKIVLEDPDDDIVLNTAISGKADYIVSGDKHLLKIANYNHIQIVTVNGFIQKSQDKDKK